MFVLAGESASTAGLRRELQFVRVYENMNMLVLMIAAAAPHERGRR